MRIIFEYVLYFYIYSFLGWCCEVIYCSDFSKKEFVNRGMLKGPICPIYGVGSCILIFSTYNFKENFLLVFILGVLITSSIEYFASFVLEKIFFARWWDYSTYPFNINGRICILNSGLFGIMTVILIRYIHKEIFEFTSSFSDKTVIFVGVILMILFFTDLIKTVRSLRSFNSDLSEIRDLDKELKKYNLSLKDILSSKKIEIDKDKTDFNSKAQKLNLSFTKNRRILKAFPRIKHKRFDEELKSIKNMLKNKNNNADE